MIRALTIAACLAASTPALAQDDFEAALAGTPAPQRSAATSAGGGYVRNSLYQKAPAPAGTIPARWRTLKRYPGWEGKAVEDALEEDVTAGLLDPAALMQQIVGTLPIPAGAKPAGCHRSARLLLFTFGEELSPEYQQMYAARRTADPQDLADRAFLDAKVTRERVASFLRAQGFRQTSAKERMGFVDEARRVRVDFYNSSAHEQYACGYDEGSLRLPTGPFLMISHFDELGTGEFWKDGGVSHPPK
jgi:hypothetical protein